MIPRRQSSQRHLLKLMKIILVSNFFEPLNFGIKFIIFYKNIDFKLVPMKSGNIQQPATRWPMPSCQLQYFTCQVLCCFQKISNCTCLPSTMRPCQVLWPSNHVWMAQLQAQLLGNLRRLHRSKNNHWKFIVEVWSFITVLSSLHE